MNDRGRFDKFTERARNVLHHAQEEAQNFQHNYIGTEHLLLGLVREEEGMAAKVLTNLGVELIKVRSTIEFIIGRGNRLVLGQIGLTPRAKKVIELAVDEARRLDHHYIGTEHLLLGLVREGEGIAAGVLESLGVHIENARTTTIQVLRAHGEKVPDAASTSSSPYKATLARSPFSLSSRRVLTFAQGEALLFLHDNIGTEHILLGLIREPGLASTTLTDAGITLDRVHDEIAHTIGQGNNTTPDPITPDPETEHLLTTIAVYSRQFQHSQTRHPQIEPPHILLALLDEAIQMPYTARTILTSLSVDLPTLHTALLKTLQDQDQP